MHIPYERQADTTPDRMCGAAALAMVYRSLGIACDRTEIWSAIATPDDRGNLFARTYRLCADALQRGLFAMTLRARDPLRVLALCSENAIRVILNHRLTLDSPLGHYTVLTEITDQHVILHDPQLGPSRYVAVSDLLKLWNPKGKGCEIKGHVLVVLTDMKSSKTACSLCHTALPDTVPCSSCGQPIPLQPVVVLGCLNDCCPERMWEHVICPSCDTRFSVPRRRWGWGVWRKN